MDLLGNPVFLLLVVILAGEAVGRVRLGAFSLGSSAILFVALVFGDLGYVLPLDFQELGLLLFIYSIGLEAGPGFVSSFRSMGLRLTAGALTIVCTGLLAALGCSLLLDLDADTTAGVLAGALTSTPGLAVAVENAGAGGAPAAYGVTYVFGVVGVIVWVKLLPRLLRIEPRADEEALAAEEQADHPVMTFRHLKLTNPNLFGRTVAEIGLQRVARVTITRLLRAGATEPVLVYGDTRLADGDRLRVVGRPDDLDKVSLFLGHAIEDSIQFNRVLTSRTIVLSKRELVGTTLGVLNLRTTCNVQVSRIVRSGVELPPDANLRLHMGDVLHVVGGERSLRNVSRVFGNDIGAAFAPSLLSILAGLLLGVLAGQLPLYFPFVGEFVLGSAGGVLLAGLVLGRLHNTGPFLWSVPAPTNGFLRDLGLMLFLATVGTRAGATIVPTVETQGLPLLLAGGAVTLAPLVVGTLVGRRLLGLPLLRLLGVLTGGMTSTPGLAATTTISAKPYASTAYATVYPAALMGMILAVKAVFLVLG